jgi:hypothetical protein
MLVIRASTAVGSWKTGNISLKTIPYRSVAELKLAPIDKQRHIMISYLLGEVWVSTQQGLDALDVEVGHVRVNEKKLLRKSDSEIGGKGGHVLFP